MTGYRVTVSDGRAPIGGLKPGAGTGPAVAVTATAKS